LADARLGPGPHALLIVISTSGCDGGMRDAADDLGIASSGTERYPGVRTIRSMWLHASTPGTDPTSGSLRARRRKREGVWIRKSLTP
jgi:hypothetical protein